MRIVKSFSIFLLLAFLLQVGFAQIVIRDPMSNPGTGDTGDLLLGTVVKMVETNTIDACGASEPPVGIITSRYEIVGAPDQYLISASGITTVLISASFPTDSLINYGDKVVTADNGRVTRIDLNPDGYVLGTALNYGGASDELKILINIHTGGGGGDPDDIQVNVTSHTDYTYIADTIVNIHQALDILDQEIEDIYGGAIGTSLQDAYDNGQTINVESFGMVKMELPGTATTPSPVLSVVNSEGTDEALRVTTVGPGPAIYSDGDLKMKSGGRFVSDLGFQFHLDDTGGGSVEYLQVFNDDDDEIFRIQENEDIKIAHGGDYVVGFSGDSAWSMKSLADVVGAKEQPTVGSIYHLPSGWMSHNMINPDSSLVWNISVMDSAIGDPATIMHGLQDGYDDGYQIATVAGEPVTIKSPTSSLLDVGDTTKALWVDGATYVDGSIEVTGDIQVSENGIYMVNATGDSLHLSNSSLDGDYEITFPNANGEVLLDAGGGSLPVATNDGTTIYWDNDISSWVVNSDILMTDDGKLQIRSADGSAVFGTIEPSNFLSDRTYTLPDASGEFSLLGQSIEQGEIDFGIGDANVNAEDLPYVPTTSGDWASPPTQVEGALDNLASRVSSVESATNEDLIPGNGLSGSNYNGGVEQTWAVEANHGITVDASGVGVDGGDGIDVNTYGVNVIYGNAEATAVEGNTLWDINGGTGLTGDANGVVGDGISATLNVGTGAGLTSTADYIAVDETWLAANTMQDGDAAGGDLSGTYPDPTVAGIQGHAVASTAPTADQVLKWNGSNWAPADDDAGEDNQNLSEVLTIGNSTGGLAIQDDTDGQVDVFGSLRVEGNEIYGSAVGDAAVSTFSNGNIRMDLDEDSDGSNDFGIRNGGNSVVFSVSEGGNVDADGNADFNGNLTLTGDSRTISTGNALDIEGNSGIDIIIDADGSGTGSEFNVQHDATGDDIFTVRENGNIQVYGELQDATGDGGTAGQVLTSTGPSGNIDWVNSATVGTDDQTISYDAGTDVITIEDGGTIDISEVDTDNQSISGSGLAGTVLTIGIEDGSNETVDLAALVNDADAVIGNEFQDLSSSRSGSDVTIAITDGTNATFTDQVDDADNVIGNEFQSLSISGHDITLSDGGGTVTVPDNVDDADHDATNEIQDIFASVTDGSNTYNASSSSDDISFTGTGGASVSVNSTTGQVTIDASGVSSTVSTNAPITGDGSPGSPISIPAATNAVSGYLTSTDRSNFQEAYGWGDHSMAGYLTSASLSVATQSEIEGNGSPASPLGLADGPSGADKVYGWNGSTSTWELVDADFSSGSVGDNWGTQVVTSDATLTGDGGGAGTALSVNWGAANDLDASGNISDFGDANDLTSAGDIVANAVGAAELADGTASGQMWQWNGSAWVFVDGTALGEDNQNISGSGLSGTTLTIGIEDGTNETVNLASLVNDADYVIGNEDVTGLSFNTSDGVLSLTQDHGGTITTDLDGRYMLSGGSDADWQIGTGTVYNTTDNIGIGTPTPAYDLDISGQLRVGTTNADPHIMFRRANYNYLQAPASGSIAFLTNGRAPGETNSSLVLMSDQNSHFNGNLGVRTGTTAIPNAFQVTGQASYTNTTDMGSNAADFAHKQYVDNAVSSATDTDWQQGAGTVYNMSDNIGIGTSTPLSMLSVNANGNANCTGYFDNPATTHNSTALYAIQSAPSSISDHVYAVRGVANTSGGYHYGVYGRAVRSPENGAFGSGRTYGVYGVAGSATDGYNYGVYANLVGGTDGAAIYATMSGDIDISGQWAGYFNGPVNIDGDLTVTGSFPTTNYYAGNDLNISGTTFHIEPTLDYVDYINGLQELTFTDTEMAAHSTGGGEVYFDQNHYTDFAEFTGGNGGGLVVRNEDGWGAVYTTANDQWARPTFNGAYMTNNLYMQDHEVDLVTYLDISDGNNYGVRFWNGTEDYSIKMGNNQEDYRWVTDYSMHFNMGATADRGFTWGYSRTNVVTSLEAGTGHFSTRGVINTDYDYRIDGAIVINSSQQLSGNLLTWCDARYGSGSHDHWGNTWSGTGMGLDLQSTSSTQPYTLRGYHPTGGSNCAGVEGASGTRNIGRLGGENSTGDPIGTAYNYGVYGYVNDTGWGGHAGVFTNSNGNWAILGGGIAGSSYNYAGYFNGNVRVSNDLTVNNGITLGGVRRTSWPTGGTGDITAVYAGNDLDGGAAAGSATLHIEPTLDYVDYINGLYRLSMASNSSYDKLRVWSSGSYAIGMVSAQSFGYLNDYAMTFTMNADTDRGFLWRDESDAATDGAMSLTTDGNLVVKNVMQATRYYDRNSTGYYTDPASTSYHNVVYDYTHYSNILYDRNSTTYRWDGSGTTRQNVLYNYGTMYMGSSATDTDDMYICDYIYDWDNTAYYIDINNVSNFYQIRARYYRDNGGGYLLNAGTGISVVENTDGSYTVSVSGTGSGDNMGDCNTRGVSIYNSSGALILNDQTYNYSTFYMGSSASDGDDMYICDRIYDWDNTGYYLDINGTSYMNYLYGAYAYFYRMYDRNSTSYYVDPASSSRFNTIYSYYVHPWSNGAYDLGNSSYRWRYAWINGIYLSGSYRSSWPGGTSGVSGSGTSPYLARWTGSTSLGNCSSAGYTYRWGGYLTSASTSDSHRLLTNGAFYGYVGTSSQYWYYVYSGYLRYRYSIGTFDTYDDLALLDNMVADADTVWDPILQNHFIRGKEENIPLCITNYGERAEDPDAEQFIDVGRAFGLAYGATRQLNNEAKARDERLVARDQILADAIGIDFSEQNSGKVTRKVFDFGTTKMNDDEIWVSFAEDFASQLDESTVPVVTVTPNCPSVVLCVIEKDNRGFKVVGVSGDSELSFDWSAFARVENEIALSDVDHLDDVFHRKSFEIPRGDFKEYVPYLGDKDSITSYDTDKVYDCDMDVILATNKERIEQDKNLPDPDAETELMFDEHGGQIPLEWVEELRRNGVKMYTKDQVNQRYYQDLLFSGSDKSEFIGKPVDIMGYWLAEDEIEAFYAEHGYLRDRLGNYIRETEEHEAQRIALEDPDDTIE